ncbi:response regulator transcription factor [Pseudanabaena sp. PCC 6802]|uniref:response regulator transcription factor n=1 Tax=Pseudanabaena sp. PCC 6802 TaxID=118173 RepID=UPI000345D259|nr:response regulator transcription factor [Pseudanabaena sp. PCC 6802]
MVRVLIATENLVMRAGLESLLKSNSELEVMSVNTNTGLLKTQVQAQRPDVVLMEWNGEEEPLAMAIADLSPIGQNHQEATTGAPAFIALTDSPEPESVVEALKAGVHAILPRSANVDEIVAAVLAAAAGLIVLTNDTLEMLIGNAPNHNRELAPLPPQALTAREIEVLDLLAEGQGNKAIAKRLAISEHTVKFHISSIFSKLNAQSRTEAVTLGARLGLILL